MRDNFTLTTRLFSFDKKLLVGTFYPRILKTNHLVGLLIHLVGDFFFVIGCVWYGPSCWPWLKFCLFSKITWFDFFSREGKKRNMYMYLILGKTVPLGHHWSAEASWLTIFLLQHRWSGRVVWLLFFFCELGYKLKNFTRQVFTLRFFHVVPKMSKRGRNTVGNI